MCSDADAGVTTPNSSQAFAIVFVPPTLLRDGWSRALMYQHWQTVLCHDGTPFSEQAAGPDWPHLTGEVTETLAEFPQAHDRSSTLKIWAPCSILMPRDAEHTVPFECGMSTEHTEGFRRELPSGHAEVEFHIYFHETDAYRHLDRLIAECREPDHELLRRVAVGVDGNLWQLFAADSVRRRPRRAWEVLTHQIVGGFSQFRLRDPIQPVDAVQWERIVKEAKARVARAIDHEGAYWNPGQLVILKDTASYLSSATTIQQTGASAARICEDLGALLCRK